MAEFVLRVKGLNVVRDGEEIIKDLSFEVREKETLIILGPNGAGKSTLLRALLGLLPYSGEIKWYTRSISYLPPRELFQRKDLSCGKGRDSLRASVQDPYSNHHSSRRSRRIHQ
jgi:ABC-type Mn2+/Zn2+ transport system ATPase subunit